MLAAGGGWLALAGAGWDYRALAGAGWSCLSIMNRLLVALSTGCQKIQECDVSNTISDNILPARFVRFLFGLADR